MFLQQFFKKKQNIVNVQIIHHDRHIEQPKGRSDYEDEPENGTIIPPQRILQLENFEFLEKD